MKIRQFSILMILVLSTTLAIAQTSENTKMSFAIFGGINFQNLNGKALNGDKLQNNMILGYHAGVNIQIPVAPEFYFQPGLLYSTKGAKSTNGSISEKYKLNYLEVPLNFVYKGLLGNGYVMVGFGPYLGYGIGGKVITEGGSVTVTRNIKFKKVVEANDPGASPYYKAFDAGANVFAGYEMASGIFLQLNTQFGMVNINPQDRRISNDRSTLKNTGFGFSLGYRLK